MLLFGERFASNYAKEAGNDARRSLLLRESNAVALDGVNEISAVNGARMPEKMRKK